MINGARHVKYRWKPSKRREKIRFENKLHQITRNNAASTQSESTVIRRFQTVLSSIRQAKYGRKHQHIWSHFGLMSLAFALRQGAACGNNNCRRNYTKIIFATKETQWIRIFQSHLEL